MTLLTSLLRGSVVEVTLHVVHVTVSPSFDHSLAPQLLSLVTGGNERKSLELQIQHGSSDDTFPRRVQGAEEELSTLWMMNRCRYRKNRNKSSKYSKEPSLLSKKIERKHRDHLEGNKCPQFRNP